MKDIHDFASAAMGVLLLRCPNDPPENIAVMAYNQARAMVEEGKKYHAKTPVQESELDKLDREFEQATRRASASRAEVVYDTDGIPVPAEDLEEEDPFEYSEEPEEENLSPEERQALRELDEIQRNMRR